MDKVELAGRLRTVVAVPVTPFNGDGSLDEPAYTRLIQRLVDGGIQVLTPNGATGEFYALSIAEAARCVELSVAAAGDALVLAGVGYDVATARQMAQDARQRGAKLILIHQPLHPYQTDRGWLRYHQEIASAVPELGVVPYVRDARVQPARIDQLVRDCPNVVGIKYAVPDPVVFASLVAATHVPEVTWICGLAERWTPFFWPGGAQGFTSGLVSVDPRLPLAMLAALQAGDTAAAMDVWRQTEGFEELRAVDSMAFNASVIKDALAQLGVCGSTVRSPTGPVPPTMSAQIRDIIDDWGLVPAGVR
jgi:4-hydroxy-tetrahydrodipicolinate synthase